MSGNGHSAYFGQTAAPGGEGTQDRNGSSQTTPPGTQPDDPYWHCGPDMVVILTI